MTSVQISERMPMRYRYTRAEIIELMRALLNIFDKVRLVEPEQGLQLTLDDRGGLEEGSYCCWMLWKKAGRCAHCVSRQAVTLRDRAMKFEFMDDDLHHVTAKYVEVDGTPYSMEMVTKLPDETMLEGCGNGRRDIVDAISRHNRRVYTDPLTGAYNRRYLDELFQGWESERAVAIIDADDFKCVNDTYGHGAGDEVLKGVVEAIMSCVRSADVVIRYGGDEFVVLFDGLPRHQLSVKLEQIRQRVLEIKFTEAPGYRQTVSIGGVCGDGRIHDLLARADKMLYHAKDGGKNRFHIEAS